MGFTIGKRALGDGEPCFIVYEAGPTHDGLDTAIDLARLAAAAGADAVKYQILDPDRLVADRKQPFSYDVLVDRASGRTETVSEPLYDILCRRSMPQADWRKLKNYCDSLGLAFFATVGFPDEVEFLQAIGCDSVKHDSQRPRDLDLLLEFLDITEDHFEALVEPLRDERIWGRDPTTGEWTPKDHIGNHKNDPGVGAARLRFRGGGGFIMNSKNTLADPHIMEGGGYNFL